MISIMDYKTESGNLLVEKLLERSQLDYGDVQKVVDEIVSDVKHNKDEAIVKYTKKFDYKDFTLEKIIVSNEEIKEAYKNVSEELLLIIKKSIIRIEDYHKKQVTNSWFTPNETGEILGQIVRPLKSVGVYVPGGKAAYPSSVIMNIIPAKVCGVKNIYMVTPPNEYGKINPLTIVAAVEAGADKIFRVGGAQSIAALAFSTQTIPIVDKIVGPGNIYVALAKRNVFGYVSIDSIAGPSEILIIADESANEAYIAADLLSQAEHDELACAILITDSKKLAKKVKDEVIKQTNVLERKDIIKKSLENYGAIIVVEDIEDAVNLCNRVAPEHVEICTNNPFDFLPKIKNAGAIFLGHYTPEPIGDYMAGPNHVLPTGGTSRFFSPLSVDDFVKKSSVLSFSKESIKVIGEDVVKFATAEGLTAHANSVRIRL